VIRVAASFGVQPSPSTLSRATPLTVVLTGEP
jgi:hypothetical protein